LCKGWCQSSSGEEGKREAKGVCEILTSFFKGNTAPIEKLLLNQINEAIEKQHFEYAAKLRDLYQHIEQFVEKQHVELPKNLTGYVLEIRQI
jgi:excinuclease UvrABC nuclease subunit